jgi:hypothetical protein
MENERYERNALIFSLGFVLAGGLSESGASGAAAMPPSPAPSVSAAAATSGGNGSGGSGGGGGGSAVASSDRDVCARHGAVLRKACEHLADLEEESRMLSDASRKGELVHLLPRILHGLRDRGECAVAADAANTIRLQLPPAVARGVRVGDDVEEHRVPLLLGSPTLDVARRWDLTVQKLLRWIDGTRTTSDIAAAAAADISLVRGGLRALVATGWVRMVDKFDMANCYVCLPPIHALANDEAARESLAAAVGRVGAAQPPSWSDVLTLYAAFGPAGGVGGGWRSVRAVCELEPAAAAHVDLRALLYAGVLNGIVRRVHTEPVRTVRTAAAAGTAGGLLPSSSEALEPSSSSRKAASERRATLRKLIDDGRTGGVRCTMDRLSTRIKLAPGQAEELVRESFPDAVWIQR